MSQARSADTVQAPVAPGGSPAFPEAWSSSDQGIVASLITVRPLTSGWCVQGEDLEPLHFARGGPAERQARRLARGFARLGRDARVSVYDARDRLAGCITYFGGTSPRDADDLSPQTHAH